MIRLRFQRFCNSSYMASYTVEASFLFPFIITVIVLIIYGSFFIHDRAILDMASYEAALRGSEITSADADIFSIVEKMGQERMKNSLFATRDIDTDISITKDKIQVRYRGDFVIPTGVVLIPGMRQTGIEVSGEGHAERLDPTGFIRECRIVENLGRNLSDGSNQEAKKH